MSIARILIALLSVLAAPELAITAAAQPLSPPPTRIELSDAQEPYRDRIASALAESLAQLSLWLGPAPATSFTVRAVTRHDGAAAVNDTISVQLPWLARPATMEVERQVAFAVAMRYWPHREPAPTLVRGLASYLAGRIVERLFNLRYARPGHSADSRRFFGGHVPWTFDGLRLDRWSAALDLPREALAFAALEHYLSWPVLQGALKALASAMRESPLTSAAAVARIGAAAGQDLAWFFDIALNPSAHLDYGVTGLTSTLAPEPCPIAGCVKTRVTVTRHGTSAFTGTSRPPVGSFQSGAGVPLAVFFSDGQQVTASWDGRAIERTFEFESPAPPEYSRLDPQGWLLLDRTRSDHLRYVTSKSNVPVGKWVSRWLVWMQDLLLTYTMFL